MESFACSDTGRTWCHPQLSLRYRAVEWRLDLCHINAALIESTRAWAAALYRDRHVFHRSHSRCASSRAAYVTSIWRLLGISSGSGCPGHNSGYRARSRSLRAFTSAESAVRVCGSSAHGLQKAKHLFRLIHGLLGRTGNQARKQSRGVMADAAKSILLRSSVASS
jgi:hypothetical protein